MEMINIDVVHKPKQARHNFLLRNCHYMLIGPTGCGKTNTLSNMLLQWMCPDKVAMYTINPDLENYQMLSDFFDVIKEESGEKFWRSVIMKMSYLLKNQRMKMIK